MILVAYLSFFLLISSVGAAKDGDDDWVHLPNKCEGKAACGAQNGLRGPLRVLQQIEKSYCSICIYNTRSICAKYNFHSVWVHTVCGGSRTETELCETLKQECCWA